MRDPIRLVGLLAAAVAAACSDGAAGGTLTLTRLEPAFADFHAAATLELTGTGFGVDVEVLVADLETEIVAASADRLTVRVRSPGRALRADVRVRSRGDEVTWPTPFVFRGMAPEALRFVDIPGTDTTEGAVVAGDFDRDGFGDVLASAGGTLRFFAGRSDGTLAPGSEAGLEGATVLGARDDLAIAAMADGAAVVSVEGATPVARPIPGLGRPHAVTFAGGEIELLVRAGSTLEVHRVEIAGPDASTQRLSSLEGFDAVSIDVADADGDDAPDLLLGGTPDGPVLLLRDETGGYRRAPAGTFPGRFEGAARFADLDLDGRADVLVEDAVGARILTNVGGRFADRTERALGGTSLRPALLADLDADGVPDLVARAPFSLHRNDATGRFFDHTTRAAPRASGLDPLASIDVDGDGDTELVARDAAGRLHVLVNWAPEPFDDPDDDGMPSTRDTCPQVADPEQLDTDADGIGDACEEEG